MSQTIDLNIVPGGSSVPMNVAAGGRTLNLSPEELRVIEAVSPTVEAERTEDGVTITVHDLHGTETVILNDGAPGHAGADGYSPEVTIATITGGHSVTITDADHPSGQTFNVMNGQDGSDGQDGEDGVSPEVTITELAGGHTVTIIDANHPGGQSFNVMDGQNGRDGQDGTPGRDGSDGSDGVTFTPTVSAEGVISWTNDGGRQNPQAVNIKGPQGDPGPGVPTVTSADNGKILRVVNGVWTAAQLPSASGVSF